MKTNRTIKCKRLGVTFSVINWFLCFGLAIGYIVAFFALKGEGNGELKQKLGTIVYGFGLSLIPMVVLAVIVKDKIRPTLWMVNIILANYLFGNYCMYTTFGVWLLSEYVFSPLTKHYKQLYVINKEIDRR